tara:strand:+ start:177 stop:572 length:396 start_codon:yes stop_codon:yes gene_type:complete
LNIKNSNKIVNLRAKIASRESSFIQNLMSSGKQKMKTSKKVVGPQIQKLLEMPVTARLVLGECRMEIDEILRLGQGSMLVLETQVEDNMKLYINDEEIAKAKSVTIGDKLGAQIMEISSTEKRLKDLTDLE